MTRKRRNPGKVVILRLVRGIHLAASCACLLVLLATAPPAAAQDLAVDLELVLAVDVSASIDGDELELQRAGYLQALSDERVVAAMLSGPRGRVALAYVEWSDDARTSVGWTVIDSPAAARSFAGAVSDSPLPGGGLTSIRRALDHSAALFEGNGIDSARRIVDLSADGRDSSGEEEAVAAARDRAVASGITINGLAINPKKEQTEVEGVRYDLAGYFRAVVVGGPGAFTMVVERPEDFPRAVARKLALEIAGQ